MCVKCLAQDLVYSRCSKMQILIVIQILMGPHNYEIKFTIEIWGKMCTLRCCAPWTDQAAPLSFLTCFSNPNARRSNQSILKEISPEYSWEGLMLKLKLQYFGHLMWRTDSFEKTLMLGKIGGGRRRGRQRMRWLDGITDSMDMSLS